MYILLFFNFEVKGFPFSIFFIWDCSIFLDTSNYFLNFGISDRSASFLFHRFFYNIWGLFLIVVNIEFERGILRPCNICLIFDLQLVFARITGIVDIEDWQGYLRMKLLNITVSTVDIVNGLLFVQMLDWNGLLLSDFFSFIRILAVISYSHVVLCV